MKQALMVLFTIVILYSCRSTITIEGNVKNLPSNTVYLLGGNINSPAIDSAKVIENKFSLKEKVSNKYAPRLVRLRAKNSKGYSETAFYLYDNKHPLDSFHNVRNLFYLEKGKTVISGDYNDKYLLIQSGKENDLQFNDSTPSEFASWDDEVVTDSISRIFGLEKVKYFIKANPNSFYFLDKLNSFRLKFSAAELKALLVLFGKEVRRTKMAKELEAYCAFRLRDTLPYSNFKLTDSNNNVTYVLDTSAQVTILNFWASWCRPCRLEIPVLKNIYDQYRQKGLNIISVSTEKSEQDWKEALKVVNMPWTQFKIPEKDREKWIQRFDAYAIPETIILSKDFKVIKKSFGYDEATAKMYQSFLSKLLY